MEFLRKLSARMANLSFDAFKASVAVFAFGAFFNANAENKMTDSVLVVAVIVSVLTFAVGVWFEYFSFEKGGEKC